VAWLKFKALSSNSSTEKEKKRSAWTKSERPYRKTKQNGLEEWL
jgi:hypothetical protein